MSWLWQACHAKVVLGYACLEYLRHAKDTLGIPWLAISNLFLLLIRCTIRTEAHSQRQLGTELRVSSQERCRRERIQQASETSLPQGHKSVTIV